jgi:RNase P protein component
MGTKMTESDARQMTASGMANYMKRSFASLVQEVAPKKLPPKTWVVAASPEESDKTKQLTTTQLQRLD